MMMKKIYPQIIFYLLLLSVTVSNAQTYKLGDDDVVVNNGIIESCSYNFAQKHIIIPDSLDGQKVTGIVSKSPYYYGVFYNKGLLEVQLPSTLKTIGNYVKEYILIH